MPSNTFQTLQNAKMPLVAMFQTYVTLQMYKPMFAEFMGAGSPLPLEYALEMTRRLQITDTFYYGWSTRIEGLMTLNAMLVYTRIYLGLLCIQSVPEKNHKV